jgi:hypothetical protein
MRFLTHTLLILCLVAAVCPTLTAQGEQPISAGLFFPDGQDQLTKKARATVDSLLYTLRQREDYRIQIAAFGDKTKDSLADAALAQRRVAQIRAYLLGVGLTPDMILAAPYRPADAPKGGYRALLKSWAIVTPTYYDIGEAPADTIILDGGFRTRSAFRPGHRPLDSLYIAMRSPFQEFRFVPGRDTVFFGREGTAIFLGASALRPLKACAETYVTIRLREVLTIGDHLCNNLSTTAADRSLLRSGGAVYVEALCADKPLPLSVGEFCRILLPAERLLDAPRHAAASEPQPGKAIQWAEQVAQRGKPAPPAPSAVDGKRLLSALGADRLLPALEQKAKKIGQQPFAQAAWVQKAFLQRHALQIGTWGWHRVGEPLPVDTSKRLTLATDLNWDETTDCKLLLSGQRTVVPAVVGPDNHLHFFGLPAGKAQLVAFRYRYGQYFWAAQEVSIGTVSQVKIQWQPISADELRKKIWAL